MSRVHQVSAMAHVLQYSDVNNSEDEDNDLDGREEEDEGSDDQPAGNQTGEIDEDMDDEEDHGRFDVSFEGN